MDATLGRFELAKAGIFQSSEWAESHDAFFTVDDVPSEVRSSVSFDSDMLNMKCTNIAKVTVKSFEIAEELATEGCAWRVHLSHENVIPADKLPDMILPDKVRIKQRKSFTYKNADATAVWKYDFTLSWTAPTKDEAQQMQFGDVEPEYEFEVELQYAHPDLSDDYLTDSILAKLQDLDLVNGLCVTPCRAVI